MLREGPPGVHGYRHVVFHGLLEGQLSQRLRPQLLRDEGRPDGFPLLQREVSASPESLPPGSRIDLCEVGFAAETQLDGLSCSQE